MAYDCGTSLTIFYLLHTLGKELFYERHMICLCCMCYHLLIVSSWCHRLAMVCDCVTPWSDELITKHFHLG